MARFVGRRGGHQADQLSLDDVLDILSNYQRRAIIEHLRDSSDHSHSIDGMVDKLRSVERARQGIAPSDDYLLSVLGHVHGPKLQKLGLVEYDIQRMEIRYYPNETVERTLDAIRAAREDDDAG